MTSSQLLAYFSFRRSCALRESSFKRSGLSFLISMFASPYLTIFSCPFSQAFTTDFIATLDVTSWLVALHFVLGYL